MRASILLVTALLSTACPQAKREDTDTSAKPAAGGESKAPASEPAEGEAATPTTRAHMQDHFSKAEEIKAALIAGNLEQAREPAKWMAEHQHEVDHPDAWKPYIDRMREAAQGIGGAEDLASASASFVSMGEVCAACHTEIGGPKPSPTTPPAAAEGSGTKAHMAKHQWAMDQLWLGLVAPSKDVWIAGAEALADAPLTPEQLAEGQTLAPEITALTDRVHDLGNQARDIPEGSGIPGRIYGELLTTCETCHAALRRE